MKIKAVAFADNLDVHLRERRVKFPRFGQSYWKDRVGIRHVDMRHEISSIKKAEKEDTVVDARHLVDVRSRI